MNRLIINTANEKLFIVLQTEDNVFSKINESKMRHNEVMISEIDQLLKEANITIKDVDELGVVIGPGSFTGIRVGVATIKAFRDSLKIPAKGINNLDYLFKLANKQNAQVNTVAIKGSKDSYFVAKYVNETVYQYDRNLNLNELNNVSENSIVGMFDEDEIVNNIVVEDNATALIECLNESKDFDLIPVYYQLSQAENEKFKHASIEINDANVKDLTSILEIEKESIVYNTLNDQDIQLALTDKNYKTFKVLLNDEVVGFVILQITDEANIVSIAIKKDYRNLGLATKLLNKAEDYSLSVGVNALSLEVSYKNIKAFLLYKKFGFVERRIRKNYYQDGSSCIEMVKVLE